jgi:hypothetical protein
MINLTFVKPKNKLKHKAFKSELMIEIIKKISEFENHCTLRNDPELLKFVCVMVENGVKKDIDKKELVLEIYQKVFSINDTEKKNISEQIDFLCDNNLISKVHSVKKNSKIFINYIKSKL